ncbi:MAG: hypothetical protein ACQGVK_12200 [Myxococcota bacterium]
MPMRLKLALRDVTILLFALFFWRLESDLRGGDPNAAATCVAVVAGVATVLCGYLAHEWGHLAGGWLSRAVVHHPRSLLAVFLFRFDADRNGRGQFLAMSLGGFAASAVVVALLLEILPRDSLAGRLALTLTLLGVVATVILELPAFWRVARGAPIPTGAAYRSAAEQPGGADDRAAA